MVKNISFISFILLSVIGLWSCKIKDLRTLEVKENYNKELGLKVLEQMSEAHSLKNWSNLETYSLDLNDEFFGLIGKLGNPFPKNKAYFEFQVIPSTFTSQLKFKDGKWKEKVWGIQSWKTYSAEKNTPVELHEKNNKKIEFWLPTYQYFIEMPLRIFEADFISFAGTKTLDGKTYDLVFATWESPEPIKKVDQYILWIDQEDHLLKKAQFTVRDQTKWVHATINYREFTKVEDFLFPTLMEVNSFGTDKTKILHKMKIDNIKINPVARNKLILFPKLGTKGKIDN